MIGCIKNKKLAKFMLNEKYIHILWVCVKSSDMHPDEVKDTPKELRYYVKMDIVPENNTF